MSIQCFSWILCVHLLLGQPEEPETITNSHEEPEETEEQPEAINEQSVDAVETTNNENNEAENIEDTKIDDGKSTPVNEEEEEETEERRQSSAKSSKSQLSEEGKSRPSSNNHLKQPSIDRDSPEQLNGVHPEEEDTEGEGVIEGKLHVVV